jgi:undecaprenyl pyrophosphate synthase
LVLDKVDFRQYLTNTHNCKIFLAPNTSDDLLVERAVKKLAENGINEDKIQINYDTQLLSTGDIYISYDPPDLVIRIVYEKKLSGIVKMKSLEMIKL